MVYQINMPTDLALGDIWATWGVPARYVTTWLGAYQAPPGLIYMHIYADNGFWVVVRGAALDCPYYPKLWSSQVSVLISQEDAIWSADEGRSSSDEPFAKSVMDFQRSLC